MEEEEKKQRVALHTGKGSPVFKITNSIGVKQLYGIIRKNKWYNIGMPVPEHDFYKIIREINNLLAQELMEGHTVKFPCRMGKLELKKRPPVYKIKNGKVRTNQPVLWGKTLKLWMEDEEARKNKTVIKSTRDFIYTIDYRAYDSNYNNKTIYQFRVNREIVRTMFKNVEEGKVDTPWQKFMK